MSGAVVVLSRGEVGDGATLFLAAAPADSVRLIERCGVDVAAGRNAAIDHVAAIAPRWEWLLFFDADQRAEHPEQVIARLLESSAHVTSALVCERAWPHPLNAFTSVDATRGIGERLRFDALEGNGLIKVAAVGMGACLLRREAVNRVGRFRVGMGDPWTDRQREDLDYTWRATQVGLSVCVDTGVIVEHEVRGVVRPGVVARRPLYHISGCAETFPAWRGDHPGL